ncbi:MAG: hypothetical protein QW542_04185 [Thermoproteota archaeon]
MSSEKPSRRKKYYTMLRRYEWLKPRGSCATDTFSVLPLHYV